MSVKDGTSKPVIKVKQMNSGTAEAINPRWWAMDSDEIFAHLIPTLKQTETRQSIRKVRNLRNAMLYSAEEYVGLASSLFVRPSGSLKSQARVTMNAVKSNIDTAASKVSKMKPRPMFLTTGGDDAQTRRAKDLTKYLEGAFDQAKVYPNMQRAFVDSAIFGTGAVKFFKEGNSVKSERVLIDEIQVDDADGLYGSPNQLAQSKYVHKDSLKAMFPKWESHIDGASSGLTGESAVLAKDFVRVWEAWRLASGEGKKDGRRAIVIENATLFDEEYKYDYFPFVFQRWAWDISGFFGVGIPDEIGGIQLELNKLLRLIQEAMHFACVPRVWVENNSMTGQITNQIGGVGKYSGSPPVFQTAQALSPEIYQHVERLWSKSFEITGISMLSATAQKPAGLNSGEALRTYQDIESDRFQLTGQRYEEAHLEATRIMIDLTKELAADKKDPFVTMKDGKAVSVIKWKDVEIKKDQYVMRLFPTSILPSQPAGKLQTVQDLTQAGFIDKDMAMKLLDFPDLEGFMSLQNASLDVILMMISKMVEDSEPQTPEPEMDLRLAKRMTLSAYLRGRANGAPEKNLELLRSFMGDCQAIIDQGTPVPAMPGLPAPGGGAPQAVPAAPPVSDLLPNGPGAQPGMGA